MDGGSLQVFGKHDEKTAHNFPKECGCSRSKQVLQQVSISGQMLPNANATSETFLYHDFLFPAFLFVFCILYLLHLYPGFYSCYTEGATWKILDLLTENLLI